MGFIISKVFDFFSRAKNPFKVVILGLHSAGKTTILYRLAIGELVKTHVTIGTNVEEIAYNDTRFQAWDLGGTLTMRKVWDAYFESTQGIIYVIDSTDSESIEDNKAELNKLMRNNYLRNAVILIFANKQDLENAKPLTELIHMYELESIKDHIWHIEPCSGLTGEGLIAGMKWLSHQLTMKNVSSIEKDGTGRTPLAQSSLSLNNISEVNIRIDVKEEDISIAKEKK